MQASRYAGKPSSCVVKGLVGRKPVDLLKVELEIIRFHKGSDTYIELAYTSIYEE